MAQPSIRRRPPVRSPRVGDEELFRRYAAGNLDAREVLAERHMPMANRLVSRYTRSSEPREDLEQSAYVGLLKAIDRYELGSGSFVSYAVATILGEVRRHFRDKGWAMNVGRAAQEGHLAVEAAIDTFTAAHGRQPTRREIGARTGLSDEQVRQALEAGGAYRVQHLEAPASASDETARTFADTVGSADPGYGVVEERADLLPAVQSLPVREQQVLYLRFFEDLHQGEIAARIGVSQMQVSRLLRRSVDRLGDQIGQGTDRLTA